MALEERTVTVVATGESAARPDRLRLSVGVQVRRDRPGDALEALSSRVTALDQVLDGLQTPTTDRQTTELSLHQDWRERSGRAEHVASSSFSVTVTDFATGAELLARAADAVGDALTVSRLEWLVADADAAEEEARRLAVAGATTTARQLATDAGAQLGGLRSIREPPSGGPPRGMAAARRAASGPPLEAGQRQIQVSVEMVWELH